MCLLPSSVAVRVQYTGADILNSSIEHNQLSCHGRADSELNKNLEITRRKFDILVFNQLTLLSELPRVRDLLQLYSDFDTIYERHVGDAKFDTVKGHGFKFLKRRLTFICHLLRKHRDITPKKRAELIDAVLSEDDIRHAQQVINELEKNKEPGKTSWSSWSQTRSPCAR